MDINLEYYKIFYCVGKTGSISGAAKLLCISQPAVSQAVKQLENSLGTNLFVRRSRGVSFTAEGEVLYSYVKQGYEYIRLGEDKIRHMIDMDNGEVRIGASDMTLRYYLLNHLEKFHKMYPGIKVSVTNAPTPETLSYLSEGKLDFGVVSAPLPGVKGIGMKPVRTISDIFIAGAKYEKYRNRKLSLKELAKLPMVCLEENTSTRTYVDSFLRENGVEITPEFEIATSDMIVQFVLKNFGVGCVVSDFAKEFLDSGEIFELKLDKPIPPRNICVAVNENVPMSNVGKCLYEMIV